MSLSPNPFDVPDPLADAPSSLHNENTLFAETHAPNSKSPSPTDTIPRQLQSFIDFHALTHEENLSAGLKHSHANSHIRSIYWKYALGVVPKDSAASHYEYTRSQYASLIESHIEAPNRIIAQNDLDPLISNPLSTSSANPWNQIYQNNELQRVIQQDLDRLFPEIPFFERQRVSASSVQSPDAAAVSTPINALMRRILFIWAKENEDISYRQGMHELLALIVWQMYRDVYVNDLERVLEENSAESAMETATSSAPNDTRVPASCVKFAEEDSIRDNETYLARLSELQMHLDATYIEHDCYAMFNRLMIKMKHFFQWNTKAASSTDTAPRIKPEQFPLYIICDRIQNHLLKQADPELHNRLEDMRIEPQIYGLRWIRMLFGREFAADDVMDLWDAIFPEVYKGFEGHEKHPEKLESDPIEDLLFVQHMATVMLIYLREEILSNQSTECLRQLMKYPHVDGPRHVFVPKTLEFREKFQQPNFRPEMLFPERNTGALRQSLLGEHSGPTPITIRPRSAKAKASKPVHQSTPIPFSPQLVSPIKKHRMPPQSMSSIQKRDKNIGKVLDHISHILQQEVIMKTGYFEFDDAVFLSIAELKRIRDVLNSEVAPSDNSVTEEQQWIKEYYERNEKHKEEEQRRKQQQQSGQNSGDGNSLASVGQDGGELGRLRSTSISQSAKKHNAPKITRKPRPLGSITISSLPGM